MNQSQLLWILLLAALVAANLPFVNDRWLAVGPRMRTRKHLGWRLGEWLVWLVAVIALGRGLERQGGLSFLTPVVAGAPLVAGTADARE